MEGGDQSMDEEEEADTSQSVSNNLMAYLLQGQLNDTQLWSWGVDFYTTLTHNSVSFPLQEDDDSQSGFGMPSRQSYIDEDYMDFRTSNDDTVGYNYLDPNFCPAT